MAFKASQEYKRDISVYMDYHYISYVVVSPRIMGFPGLYWWYVISILKWPQGSLSLSRELFSIELTNHYTDVTYACVYMYI